MSQTPHIELVEQLSRNSRPYRDPLTRVDWERLDLDSFWLPEAALSLHGLDEFAALPIERHRAMSQQEYLHIVRTAMWLTTLFMERLSRAARRSTGNAALTVYRLHELREWSGHALMFHELFKRVTAQVPKTGWVVGTRLLSAITAYAPLDSMPYRLVALIGTDIPDRLNRFLRQYREEICPAVYDMINIQVMDSTRHIAHARDAVETGLRNHSQRWRPWLQSLARHALRRIVTKLFYPPPEVYERAGLRPGVHWSKAAQANVERRRFITSCIAPTRRLLTQSGFEV